MEYLEWSALNKCWNLLIDPSFFPTVNTFFERHFCSSIKTRLLTFPLTCRNNLYGCIFLKEINQTACVFPSYVYFLGKKCILRKNVETGVLEVLQSLLLPNHGGQTFTIFSRTFYNLVVACLQFTWKWKD